MPVFVIMGVSGSGKSTVGQALADKLDCPFYDGDDFHPPDNVAKMSRGIPLTDDDRRPWLMRLSSLITQHQTKNESAIVACSALKKSYRDLLRNGNSDIIFVYLDGSFDLIWERMKDRKDHYMKPDMLQSQFDALESPTTEEAITIRADQKLGDILAQLLQAIGKQDPQLD